MWYQPPPSPRQHDSWLILKADEIQGKEKQQQQQKHLGYPEITKEIMEDTLKNDYPHDPGRDPWLRR